MDWNNRIDAKQRTGICLCGCGQPTSISKVTRRERGDLENYPLRYVYGHNTKAKEWRDRVSQWTSKANWKGGITIHKNYVLRHRKTFSENELRILEPMFERRKRGYILEHRALVALREERTLSKDEFVRHLDGNRRNNSLQNLILGTAKDNFNDHDSARKEVMLLKRENADLRKRIQELEWRLHAGPKGEVVWEGTFTKGETIAA